MSGHLIIIEGGDGCGKATQTELLYRRLEREGLPVMAVSFPDYDSPSSALVKMYLEGDFGTEADAVNPYAASAFYAVDRFASYQCKWKEFYEQGGIVLADRYTTSNMLYQMIKLDTETEQSDFLDWLVDFEFGKMGLPAPEAVILLDVPLSISEELMAQRMGKTGGQTGDIHEGNRSFLARCHAAYQMLARRYGWECIDCAENGRLRTPAAIHDDVYDIVRSILKR